ncbi:MAG: acetoacetate--CoA ligase, partial [Mycobacteriales bacterium]
VGNDGTRTPGQIGSQQPSIYQEFSNTQSHHTAQPSSFKTRSEFFHVRFHHPPRTVLENPKLPRASWFRSATLNYAEHALRKGPGKRDEDLAVIALTDAGHREQLTYGQLRTQVAAARQGLLALGVTQGDRVVALVPNCAQTLVAFLATASIGAIWSSCSPEFGATAVRDRFAQLEPKVLITVDGYQYASHPVQTLDVVRCLQAELPTLRATVLIGYSDPAITLAGTVSWSQLLATTDQLPELDFTPVPFSHPLWVLYSSGTTGLPKGIVHGHGGMLLEHLKALSLQADLAPGDRFFWYTTTGWMMWNFLIAGLLVGCTVVLYDGAPLYPSADALWQLVQTERINYFGSSAAYLLSCAKQGLIPASLYDLSELHAIGSTGSPLPAHVFDWINEHVGQHVKICSISGGTDMCTAFLGAAATVPVWRGELSCAALGAAVAAFDDAGESVIGAVGELVLTQPMPCMPVMLWNDINRSRMTATYFDRYPNVYPKVWSHGDWIRVTERGSCVLYGRSDATLNRGGVRMGTAEFYRIVESFDEVHDCLVIDTSSPLETDRGLVYGELLCFVVLDAHTSLAQLEPRLRAELASQLSPRHIPDRFLAVAELPVTLNGKKCEVPVKRILTGTPVEKAVSLAALRNPAALIALCELVHSSSHEPH